MNLNILSEYCAKCKAYGWTPSWDAFKKYVILKERGLIKLWAKN